MNKPIIIDGVDVSECEYCIIAGAEFPECRIKIASFDVKCENYNCYFKQLQRLKAENEELKEEYKQFQRISAGEVNRLRKALEEVREIAYTTDFDIADIQKIVNEVLK